MANNNNLGKKALAEVKKGIEAFTTWLNTLPTLEEKQEAIAMAFSTKAATKAIEKGKGVEKPERFNPLNYFSRGYSGVTNWNDDDRKIFVDRLPENAKNNLANYSSPERGFGSVIQYRHALSAPWFIVLKLEEKSNTNYRIGFFNALTGEAGLVQKQWVADVVPNYWELKAAAAAAAVERKAESKKEGKKLPATKAETTFKNVQDKYITEGLKKAVEVMNLYKTLETKQPEKQEEKQA